MTRPRILLVEDNSFIREALAELLGDEGFTVQTAAHGGHGLAALERGPDYDLILLDLVMPEVSGLMFREAQLLHPAWVTVPTIVLTADLGGTAGLPSLRGAVLAQKPLNVTALLKMVRQLCPQQIN